VNAQGFKEVSNGGNDVTPVPYGLSLVTSSVYLLQLQVLSRKQLTGGYHGR
jgi:hypothetical protein